MDPIDDEESRDSRSTGERSGGGGDVGKSLTFSQALGMKEEEIKRKGMFLIPMDV